jgi:acyl-CoA thioesterase FadM
MKLTEWYTETVKAETRTIPAYMTAMEEAGLRHLALNGHALEDLWKQGESMMFSRAGIRLYRTEESPDRVETRIAACKGVRAQRYFRFYAGDVMTAEAMNESFCVRMDTHQVIRSAWLRLEAPVMETDFALRRLSTPKQTMRPAGVYEVRPSETDYNGHLHNTHYWSYALKALDVPQMPSEMHLQFLREILPGYPFELYRTADGHTVMGQQNGGTAFVAEAFW